MTALHDDPFWIWGCDEDFVSAEQRHAWRYASLALDCTHVPIGGGADPAEWEWGFACLDRIAPLQSRVAAFLQRGERITPGLAKIVGRVLAGEPFFSPPCGDLDDAQFDGRDVADRVAIWAAPGHVTPATLAAWTFRLHEGAVSYVGKPGAKKAGVRPQIFRARHVLQAAETAIEAMASGRAKTIAINDAAQKFRVTVAETRAAIRGLKPRK